MLPDDAEFLLRGRFRHLKYARQIIVHGLKTYDASLWRPLIDPVTSFPLAVTDGTSVDFSSLVDVRKFRRGSISATTFMTHHEGIRWYYQSMQSPEDLLIFKNYDSDETVARGELCQLNPGYVHADSIRLSPCRGPNEICGRSVEGID